jgi:hypothetical protein
MRLDQSPLHLEHSGLSRTTDFTIKASAKAFQILFSNLYSDPVMAVLRELICNAWDAHARAGKQDTPIHVHLPTGMDMELRVKDQGTGISHPGMHSLFVTVFDSDKNNTNDEIGGLGLGSKSPYSLTDQYHLRSVFMGVARRYTAFMQVDGTPGLADVGPAEEVDEADGFEVIVPVAPQYRNSFNDRYARFVQTMPTHPTSNFHETITPLTPILSREVGDYRVEVLGNAHESRHEYGTAVIIMGIVPYTITGGQKYDLPEIFRDRGVIIHAPIGAFEVNPSREALSLKPQDFERLHTLAEAFTQTLRPFFQERITQATDALDLSTKHHELLRSATLSKLYRKTLDTQALTWKGYDVKDIAPNSLLEVPINNFSVNHLNTRIMRNHSTRMERITNAYATMGDGKLRPEQILFADRNKPYRHMLDFDLLAKNDSVWVLTGDLAAIERWLRMYGLWDRAEAITKAPPKARDPNNPAAPRENFGSFQYTVESRRDGRGEETRSTVAQIEELAAMEGAVMMGDDIPSSLSHFLRPETRIHCVTIPDSHSKVQKHFAANIASYGSWVDFARDHVDYDLLLDALSAERINNRVEKSAALMAAADRINRWSAWNTWEVDWLPQYATNRHFDEPLQTLSERVTYFAARQTRCRTMHVLAADLRNKLGSAWPNLDAHLASNDRQWGSFLTAIEREMTDLRNKAPALFRNNDRSTPPELVNAYLKEVRYGQ